MNKIYLLCFVLLISCTVNTRQFTALKSPLHLVQIQLSDSSNQYMESEIYSQDSLIGILGNSGSLVWNVPYGDQVIDFVSSTTPSMAYKLTIPKEVAKIELTLVHTHENVLTSNIDLSLQRIPTSRKSIWAFQEKYENIALYSGLFGGVIMSAITANYLMKKDIFIGMMLSPLGFAPGFLLFSSISSIPYWFERYPITSDLDAREHFYLRANDTSSKLMYK